MPGERALLLFQPRHVRVAKERYAVRRERYDLFDRMGKAFHGLVRKAIDQVDVDAIEAELAGGENQVAGQFKRLDAVDGLLHFRVEILHPHTQAIETQLAKHFQVLARRHARIDLDADFRLARKREMRARVTEKIFDLRRRQIRRRSAAPMKLYHLALP